MNFYLDGCNICLMRNDRQVFSLSILLGLCTKLIQDGHNFVCFFDATANTRALEEKHAKKILTELLTKYGTYFRIVPGKIEADSFILSEANKTGSSIISNDQYRNYGTKYPWLVHKKEKRLFKGGAFIERNEKVSIIFPDLDINISLSIQSTDECDDLFKALDNRQKQTEEEWRKTVNWERIERLKQDINEIDCLLWGE